MEKAKVKAITPLQAVRKYCLQCCGGSSKGVTNCSIKNCRYYPYRLNKGRISVKVIKKFCMECMNADGNGPRAAFELVKRCPSLDCPLFSYRRGRNPKRSGKGNTKGNAKSLNKPCENAQLCLI